MAPLATHLVIGERVFVQIQHFDPTPPVYGAFLLGCVLVDVNNFEPIDRRQTHFVGHLDEDGEDAFKKSCTNFLSQLPSLLLHPWDNLARTEQAFVAGYLCHLAADEPWKAFAWNLLQTLEITSHADLPVPTGVILTAFSVLSREMLVDPAAVTSALNHASIPHVLAHIPHGALQRMRDVAQAYMLDDRTPESYFKLLERQGKTNAEVQAVRQQHDLHWESAIALIRDTGGVEPYIQTAVERAVHTVPQLWAKRPSGYQEGGLI